MKHALNWHKRKRITELIKTFLIYIFLVVIAISGTLNYLFFKEDIVRTETKTIQDTQIKYIEVPKAYFFDNEGNEWEWYTVTGYSANDPTQGTTNIVATGFDLTDEKVKGLKICASNYIPKYSIIEIEGLGAYIVLDTGLGYKTINGWEDDHWVDIYFGSKGEALAFGRQQRRVRIIN